MKNLIILLILLLNFYTSSYAKDLPSYSTAGFHELENSGREVFNMNVAWRFYKGIVSRGYEPGYNDSDWDVVSLPHGIELLPEEASGSVNYQGEVWYRKRFTPDKAMSGKKIFLYFEAIMGKSKIWLNGVLVKEHFGGYLPVVVDITSGLVIGKENIITVCADNSDDPSYPPGKPQKLLDFSYFGGIYRDCWLVTHDKLHITDANFENEKAGGGILISYRNISEQKADIDLKLHIRNEYEKNNKGSVSFTLRDQNGKNVAVAQQGFSVKAGDAVYVAKSIEVKSPSLWSPDSPYLYYLDVRIKDSQGNVIDGYTQRVGLRSIDFRGKDGFWLNGKPYNDKLIGANRHQDFALIGNALPNSLHWRDAKKLREVGMKVIRCAHYPQDPAFMDACDELGLFIIVATPGWQFWNDDPVFAQRIYDDIRNMVRRDRNRASLFFWEPILNETRFPLEFSKNALKCVVEEYPFPGNYSACDPGSKGSEHFPVIYSHPSTGNNQVNSASDYDPSKVYFTREFGDNVDDWSSHNSSSRASRKWGEIPMLIQSTHYAAPDYPFTCIETLYKTDRQHIGGTLWHSFDHQRGYHPDPFYGGIMDAFRQPKTSYYLFMSQRPPYKNEQLAVETGPMVYIAHEMTPFSPADVTVYSNCDEVRLTVYADGEQRIYKRSSNSLKMPSPIIIFKNVFDFMDIKKRARAGKQKEVYFLAEGFINGKLVASQKKMPSWRPVKVNVRIDNDGIPLKADGSDIVTVIAEIVDAAGTIKRLDDFVVRFSVEGEGVLLGDSRIGVNPCRMAWGSTPILLQSTINPGKITIKASIEGDGINAIAPGELIIESVRSNEKFVYDPEEVKFIHKKVNEINHPAKRFSTPEKETMTKKLKDVEQQQEDFGEKR